MTDQPPPRRSFWRVHLLTALVMVLVAAAFLYLNVQATRYHLFLNKDNEPELELVKDSSSGGYIARGCPFCFQDEADIAWFRMYKAGISDGQVPFVLMRRALVADILTGLACVFLAACISEFLIRRRERQRAMQAAESGVPCA